MPVMETSVETVSEIRVEPLPTGLTAVYMVETRTPEEGRELESFFDDLETQAMVRQLCTGPLVAFAVHIDESDSALLDEIDDVLRSNYAFVVTQRSFDEVIQRIVVELCGDTGSRTLPMPRCNICGKAEPFPNTMVRLSDEDGDVLISRNYCGSCTAGASATSNKDFVRALLSADEQDFGELEKAEMVRHPSRRHAIRFRIRPDKAA